MDVNESVAYSREETAQSKRGGSTTGVGQNSLKRKSSLKSLDSSSSQRIGTRIDSNDANFVVIAKDKSVRFSNVAIRDYSLCPGDNPSVSRGVPISLDWDYDEEHSYNINKFEDGRFGQRRFAGELKLPSLERIQLLKGVGYSRGEINERVKDVRKAKEKRLSTRRSVERGDQAQALFRRIKIFFGIIMPTSSPGKKEHFSCTTNTDKCDTTCLLEPDEETLTSSISSKKSELSVTEFNGRCVSSLLLEDSNVLKGGNAC